MVKLRRKRVIGELETKEEKPNMEFYSAIKKNKIISFAGEWMFLENIMISEISQSQKVKGVYVLSEARE